MLIASQRPTATHVAGYHMWNQMGRSVKKGEKGIMILAPMVVKQEPVQGQNEAQGTVPLGGGFAPPTSSIDYREISENPP